ERGDGVLGLFAIRPEANRGADAGIGALALEGFDERRHDLRRVPLLLRQEANRFQLVAYLGPLQIHEQLVGRFLLAAAAARQQAKGQNKRCPRAWLNSSA